MINMTSETDVLKMVHINEFSKKFDGYFVSVLLIHICDANTNNRQVTAYIPRS